MPQYVLEDDVHVTCLCHFVLQQMHRMQQLSAKAEDTRGFALSCVVPNRLVGGIIGRPANSSAAGAMANWNVVLGAMAIFL